MKLTNTDIANVFCSCRTLRYVVSTSAFLFIAAIVVEILALSRSIPALSSYLGFLLVFAAVGALGVALVVILLPGADERMEECRR